MRKNILIFGHNYATQFIDIFNQYACLFPADNYAVTVAYLTGEPNEAIRQRTQAEEVLFLNVPKKSLRTLKVGAIRKLLKLCKEKNFQMVICHRYKPSYIMLWVNLWRKIPALVFVMHELKTMSHLGRQLLIAALANKKMLFAGVSNAVRDDMRKDLWPIPNERIVTLYNVIDFNLTEPSLLSRDEARAALNFAPADFIFGNVARLAPNKDQATLINAFANIKPHCPRAKLVLVGDGVLEANLKQQVVALKLTNDILFTGYVESGFRYMRAFDCFTLSSIQEAFGRVLLEAMLAKTPVIASAVNGIPEVLADAGVLVPARDVQQFAAAMQAMYELTPTERLQLVEHAYQHTAKHFSIPPFQAQFWQQPVLAAIKE